MGIVERRERERFEVRRMILEAARSLFASEGYERVTMRRIADSIEYSPTTIYHHFEDKDDLVKALCEEDFSQLLQALASVAPPSDPVEAIKELGRAYCRFGLEHPNQYRFMFMTPNKVDEPEPESPGHQSFDVLRRLVETAQRAGRLRPGNADTIAQVLWSSLHGAIALLTTLQPQHWPTPAAPDLVEQVVENSIRGFLAS